MIDKGQHILQDESLIATLNISQICQEKLDWKHLDLFFSKNTKKAAYDVRISDQSPYCIGGCMVSFFLTD